MPDDTPPVECNSTFDKYKSIRTDKKSAIDKLIEDSERCVGKVRTEVLSENDYEVKYRCEPQAMGGWNPETNSIELVDSPRFGTTYPMLWVLLLHEKGHAFDFPRTDYQRMVELAILSIELGKRGLCTAMPPRRGENSFGRVTCMNGLNMIDDALINYMQMYNYRAENDDQLFGWFARASRVMYETALLEMDLSKEKALNSTGDFHHRFMTALSWFYLGVDGPAPDKYGMTRRGIEPYRSLCEVTCNNPSCTGDAVSHDKKFATWDFLCPFCGTFNNRIDPEIGDVDINIGLFTDPRSPISTQSSDKRVKQQYEVMQKWFIWVTKLPWAWKQPAKRHDDVFFNKFYKTLSALYAEILSLGCRSGVMEKDIPCPLAMVGNGGRIEVTVAGKKTDVTVHIAKAFGLERGSSVSIGREDVRKFCDDMTDMQSDKYKELKARMKGGLKVEDIIPRSASPIYGVYDCTRYKSLDDWQDKEFEPVLIKKMRVLKEGVVNDHWKQDRFEAEFMTLYASFSDEEKIRARLMMLTAHSEMWSQFDIDTELLLAKLEGRPPVVKTVAPDTLLSPKPDKTPATPRKKGGGP